ncbi:MAG: hypothetical protein ACPGR2_13070 [Psychrobium sp.]
MKIRYIALICTLIISAGLYYLIADDDLNPEIIAIQQQYAKPINLDNNVYIEMMSWQYLESDNPYQLAVDAYQQKIAELSSSSIRDISPIKYPIVEYHGFAEQPYDCSLSDENCIAELINNREKFESIITDNRKLLDKFYNLRNFHNFEPPNPLIVTARFDLTAIYKIAALDLLFKIADGKYESAEKLIAELILFDKRLMSSTDELLFKIIPIMNIDSVYPPLVDYLISMGFTDWSYLPEALSPLSFEELSLNKAWRFHIYRDSQWLKFEEIANRAEELKPSISHLWPSLIYKEHITLNKLAEFHFLQLLPNNFPKSQLMEQRKVIEKLSSDIYDSMNFYIECELCGMLLNINNIAGYLMELTAVPRYVDLYEDLIKVDLKLQLLRLKLSTSKSVVEASLSDNQWRDPYLNSLPFIKDGKVCYKVEDDVCI